LKNSLIFALTLALFSIPLGVLPARALDTRLEGKFGTIDFSERGNKAATGHKFMTGLRAELGGEKLRWSAGAELWSMFEPDDEDLQIVHNGISADGEVGYRFKLLPDLSLSPFLGASIDRWQRNSSGERWGELFFAKIAGGAELEWKSIRLRLGGSFLFGKMWIKAKGRKGIWDSL